MSSFSKDRQPSLTQWTNSSVQASIILDQQTDHAFTNLDEISGKVIVRCAKEVTVNSIIVKLEGESRTRLLGTLPDDRRQEPKVQLEHHKILYKVQTVFPPTEVAESRSPVGRNVFTLPAGTHEYPWKFKLPFNNACHTPPTTLPGIHMGMSSRGLEIVREASTHVKKTLPPTLRGFPGEAEISYFVKTTIQRQGILKENPRAYSAFQFLPVEPPRPGLTGSRVYARQRHTFTPVSRQPSKKSIFGSLKSASPTSPTFPEGPAFSLDMRLPEPAILTCNQPMPISIVVTKQNNYDTPIYLQSLQISLIGFTKIRAHEFERIEQGSWIMMSRSNMNVKIGQESDPIHTETTLDDSGWRSLPLPNTVAPSFETCNISRYYQVEARLGFSCGGGGTFSTAKPQQIVLALRLDAQIYSGIVPPQEVLSRMAARLNTSTPSQQPPIPEKAPVTTNGKDPIDIKAQPSASAQQTNGPSAGSKNAPPLPTRPGQGEVYADAPPSYEDAIASDLPPIDGYRPAYAPPPAVDDHLLHQDEKRGWHR